MFWWGFPIMCTGGVIFLIGIIAYFFLSFIDTVILIDVSWFVFKIIIVWVTIGVAIAMTGFGFWCIAGIWGPYV